MKTLTDSQKIDMLVESAQAQNTRMTALTDQMTALTNTVQVQGGRIDALTEQMALLVQIVQAGEQRALLFEKRVDERFAEQSRGIASVRDELQHTTRALERLEDRVVRLEHRVDVVFDTRNHVTIGFSKLLVGVNAVLAMSVAFVVSILMNHAS